MITTEQTTRATPIIANQSSTPLRTQRNAHRSLNMQTLAHGNSLDSSFNAADYSGTFYDDSDADVEQASTLGSTIFDVNNMLGVLDAEIYHPIDSILMMESADGRVSLAYERLSHIPRPFAETFAHSTHTLDLSHNNLKDLSFLANFRHLTTLILDQNDAPLEHTLPHLPALRILWLNNCRIHNLTAWMRRLQSCCPALQHLSMLGNPGCLCAFNGGTILEHLDYRLFVVGALPQLSHLDDAPVTEAQREQAALHRSAYAQHGGPMRFVEKFGATQTTQTTRLADVFQQQKQQQRRSVTNGGHKRGKWGRKSTTTSATTDSSQS